MTKHFCCCLSLKTGAIITVFISLIGGIIEIFGGNRNFYSPYSIFCILLGCEAIFSGIILILGIVQRNAQFVLLYLLLGFLHLFIITICTLTYMFDTLVFFLSVFLPILYCQFCIYNFYKEVSEYNAAKSGVIEIVYNNHHQQQDLD